MPDITRERLETALHDPKALRRLDHWIQMHIIHCDRTKPSAMLRAQATEGYGSLAGAVKASTTSAEAEHA